MSPQRNSSLPRLSGLIGSNTAEFARKLITLRKWERENLPMFSPQIATDVLLHCAASALHDGPSASKEFHLATGHSKDRVREIVQQLIELGIICYLVDPRDTRVRRVMLTPRGAALVESYRRELLDCIGAEGPSVQLLD